MLYSNLTIKEWLATNCVTNHIVALFHEALDKSDEPMAILTLTELMKRGDYDKVMFGLQEANKNHRIIQGTHFAIVLANAMTQVCSRDPILSRVAKFMRLNDGKFPDSAEDITQFFARRENLFNEDTVVFHDA